MDPGDGSAPALVDEAGRGVRSAAPAREADLTPAPVADFGPRLEPAATVDGTPSTGFDPEISTEVVAERDEFRRVFANPDGSRTVQASSMPIHYRDGAGAWQQIDNRVIDDGRGGLVNAANGWQVRFAPMGAGGVTVRSVRGAQPAWRRRSSPTVSRSAHGARCCGAPDKSIPVLGLADVALVVVGGDMHAHARRRQAVEERRAGFGGEWRCA